MSSFEEALRVDVKPFIERKKNYDYLTWSIAWREFKKLYPSATYKIAKNNEGYPEFKSENGSMVFTEVTVDGIAHEMWLPVMDYKNDYISNPSSTDVNKSVMRCLVKNLAMFGLGLTVYAGEDLPEEQKNSTSSPNKTQPKKEQTEEEKAAKAKIYVDGLITDLEGAVSVDDIEQYADKHQSSDLFARIKANYPTELSRYNSFLGVRREELGSVEKYGV